MRVQGTGDTTHTVVRRGFPRRRRLELAYGLLFHVYNLHLASQRVPRTCRKQPRAGVLVTRYRREAPKLATKVPQRNVGVPCLRLFHWRGKDCCPGPAGPRSGNDRFRRRILVPAGTCINCSNASGSWSGSRPHVERSAFCGRTGEEQYRLDCCRTP